MIRCWSPLRQALQAGPFWKGDAPGRPWSWVGHSAGSSVSWAPCLPTCASSTAEAGLDEFAANNLVSYLAEQQAPPARCQPTRP
jgi:ATP-dependent Lhr-like helicase